VIGFSAIAELSIIADSPPGCAFAMDSDPSYFF